MALLYQIQAVPGKGQGLVAQQDIRTGTRILSEAPLLTTEGILLASQTEGTIAKKLRCLSKAQQRDFLSLYNNNFGKQPFSGLVRTNALPLGPGSRIGGIFPVISRINHDCCLNTQHTRNSSIKQETIHATSHIKAREEITISYNLGGPRQLRRERMKEFKFDCTCNLCRLLVEGLPESDDREIRMQILDGAIGDADRVMASPGGALADCASCYSCIGRRPSPMRE